MAPELIKKEPYDCQVDIFSLGVTAFELSEGNPPNHDKCDGRIKTDIVLRPAPKLSSHRSAQFQDFVQKCLIKDPAKRPSAAELLTHEFLADADNYREEFGKLV